MLPTNEYIYLFILKNGLIVDNIDYEENDLLHHAPSIVISSPSMIDMRYRMSRISWHPVMVDTRAWRSHRWSNRSKALGTRMGLHVNQHGVRNGKNWSNTLPGTQKIGGLVRTGSRGSHITDAFNLGRSTKELWKIHSDVQRLVWAQWMVRQRAIATSCRKRRGTRNQEPVPVVAFKSKSCSSFPLRHHWQRRTRKPRAGLSTGR